MQSAPIGLLITNLGTPDAPTAPALRRYLAEFLWDRRVVDLPRPLWWLILHGIILRTRPARSARLYEKIWTREGAPLLAISLRQARALAALLGRRRPELKVVLGMRYGQPAISTALCELRASGCRQIVVLPLYPQNSCSTTASTFDAVAAELASWRELPALRFISDYHLHPGYLEALVASIREAWRGRPPAARLLFSFHGTPARYRAEGDPYYQQCLDTASAVAARLGLEPGRWQVAFQSRFGREEWLQPYTDEVLGEMGQAGVASVEVVCPGFAADCLETLEEIAGENRSLFLKAGGREYHYIPALNDRSDHITALADRVEAELRGWGFP